MYPITSKSSSGILIIFLVFSEIQSFITENDTTDQFCSNDNASTKEWLETYSVNNKGCHHDKFGSFGGSSNRLRGLPGEILEDNRNSKREISIENNIQQQFPQFKKNNRVVYEKEPRNSKQQDFVQREMTNMRQVRNTREKLSPSQRSFEDIRTHRISRGRSQFDTSTRTRQNEDSLQRTIRVSSENVSKLERSFNRQSRENRFNSSKNGRSSRSSENRMEERRVSRDLTDELRSVDRIRQTRMDGSERRTLSRNRESLGTQRFIRESSSMDSSRRLGKNFRRSTDRQVFSRNSPSDENRLRRYGDRSELQYSTRRESYETRRNTEDPGVVRASRSRENSSKRSHNRNFLPGSSSRAESSSRSFRKNDKGLIDSKIERDETRKAEISGDELTKRVHRIRQIRMDGSETQRLSRNGESLQRSIRSFDRQLFSRSSPRDENIFRSNDRSSRNPTEFSENRRQNRMNTRASADGSRLVNRIEENTRVRSESRTSSKDRVSSETRNTANSREKSSNSRRSLDRQLLSRSSSRAENRLRSSRSTDRSSRVSTVVPENQREQRRNSRTAEDVSRSVNRMRETRMEGSEPRSQSRDHESLGSRRFTRGNSEVDSTKRSKGNLGRFLDREVSSRNSQRDENRFRSNDNRRYERMNSRTSSGDFRRFSRIRETRMDESLGTRRFTRENSEVGTARRSRENSGRSPDRQLFSRSSRRDEIRSRSNERNSRELEYHREKRMKSGTSADGSILVNKIREARMDDTERRSLSRERDTLGTRRNTREHSGVDTTTRRLRENLSRSSNRQVFSRSSQREGSSFRSDDRNLRSSVNQREGRTHSRASVNDFRSVNRIRGTSVDGTDPRSLSRDRESLGTRRFTRGNSGVDTTARRSRENLGRSSERYLLPRSSLRGESRLRSNERNSRVERMNSRTSADISRLRINTLRHNSRSTRYSSNSREQLDKIQGRENILNTRRFDYKIREVSEILHATRNLRNVPIEHQRKMKVPILGKYSRNGETLDKIFLEQTSTWFKTIQISLVVVLLGQLFMFNGNKKIGISGMNMVGMLKRFRA